MFVKGMFKSGEYISPVPVGIPTTIQYNEKGIIDRIFYGYDEDKIGMPEQILNIVYNNKTAPQTIPVKGGTTWVSGVLYCDREFFTSGNLPDAIKTELIDFYIQNPKSFNFFAGNVKSLSVVFSGAVPIRQWLKMAKFNVLPGWVLPANCSRDTIYNMINTDQFTFRFPKVMYFMIYNNDGCKILSTNLTQHIVSGISIDTDIYGNIKAAVMCTDDWVTCIGYPKLVELDIHKNDCILVDDESKIIYSVKTSDRKRKLYTTQYACKWCGKQFTFTAGDSDISCTDEHCLSTMYPNINHFIKALNLPNLSFIKYKKLVKNKEITCFTDIMLLAEYCDIVMDVSISELIKAVIPVAAVRDTSIIDTVCNHCNQNRDSIHYYLFHPDAIISDFNLSGLAVSQFIAWLSDIENATIIDTLMYSKNFKFSETLKKFNGDPIFRNKHIVLTGRFKHGDVSDIKAILQSYSAEVTTKVSNETDCILVGGLHEDINGILLNTARKSGIPIFEEDSFFAKYEIDKDIQAYL